MCNQNCLGFIYPIYRDTPVLLFMYRENFTTLTIVGVTFSCCSLFSRFIDLSPCICLNFMYTTSLAKWFHFSSGIVSLFHTLEHLSVFYKSIWSELPTLHIVLFYSWPTTNPITTNFSHDFMTFHTNNNTTKFYSSISKIKCIFEFVYLDYFDDLFYSK
jgi:hypothetical protein